MAAKTASAFNSKRLLSTFILTALLSIPALANTHINIPLYEKGSDVYYLQATLEGYGKTEFMLDTGSGPMAVASDILATLKQQGKAIRSGQGMAMLANGQQKHFALYRISSLQLSADCHLHNVEAAELPAGTRNIIGINALKKTAPFSIHTSPAQLSLGGCALASPPQASASL